MSNIFTNRYITALNQNIKDINKLKLNNLESDKFKTEKLTAGNSINFVAESNHIDKLEKNIFRFTFEYNAKKMHGEVLIKQGQAPSCQIYSDDGSPFTLDCRFESQNTYPKNYLLTIGQPRNEINFKICDPTGKVDLADIVLDKEAINLFGKLQPSNNGDCMQPKRSPLKGQAEGKSFSLNIEGVSYSGIIQKNSILFDVSVPENSRHIISQRKAENDTEATTFYVMPKISKVIISGAFPAKEMPYNSSNIFSAYSTQRPDKPGVGVSVTATYNPQVGEVFHCQGSKSPNYYTHIKCYCESPYEVRKIKDEWVFKVSANSCRL